jgi:hypothetical protein
MTSTTMTSRVDLHPMSDLPKNMIAGHIVRNGSSISKGP